MDIHSRWSAPHKNRSNRSQALEDRFGESLHIQESKKLQCASGWDCNRGGGDAVSKAQATKSKKSATFPYPDMDLPPSSSDEEEEKLQCASGRDRNRGGGDAGLKVQASKSHKFATFPYADMDLPPSSSDEEVSEDEDEEGEEEDGEADLSIEGVFSDEVCYSGSPSLPPPEELVSAIKGSRAKRGSAAPSKLTVTWAPDVYDPEPDSLYEGRKQLKTKKIEKIEKLEKKERKGQKGSGRVKKQYNRHRSGSDISYI